MCTFGDKGPQMENPQYRIHATDSAAPFEMLAIVQYCIKLKIKNLILNDRQKTC